MARPFQCADGRKGCEMSVLSQTVEHQSITFSVPGGACAILVSSAAQTTVVEHGDGSPYSTIPCEFSPMVRRGSKSRMREKERGGNPGHRSAWTGILAGAGTSSVWLRASVAPALVLCQKVEEY